MTKVSVPRVTWQRHCRLRRAAFAHHGKAEMPVDATDSYREMLKATWALAQDEAVEEWISVEDKLPEPGALVLAVTAHSRTRTVAEYDADAAEAGLASCWVRHDGPRWSEAHGDFVEHATRLPVTHWMPLPELPR